MRKNPPKKYFIASEEAAPESVRKNLVNTGGAGTSIRGAGDAIPLDNDNYFTYETCIGQLKNVTLHMLGKKVIITDTEKLAEFTAEHEDNENFVLNDVTTEGGPQPDGTYCVLPFKFNGITQDTCIKNPGRDNFCLSLHSRLYDALKI